MDSEVSGHSLSLFFEASQHSPSLINKLQTIKCQLFKNFKDHLMKTPGNPNSTRYQLIQKLFARDCVRTYLPETQTEVSITKEIRTNSTKLRIKPNNDLLPVQEIEIDSNGEVGCLNEQFYDEDGELFTRNGKQANINFVDELLALISDQ